MEFVKYYEMVKPEIERHMQEMFKIEPEIIRRIFEYSTRGGKRFRPTLVLLAADVLGGRRSDALDYAVVIELLHNASLAHDDVIDADELRRGMPTLHKAMYDIMGLANKVWGKLFGKPKFRDPISLAILAGDGMLARALLLLKTPEAVNAFADTVYALLKGAVMEVKHAKEYIDKGLYYDVIVLKTASLFATSMYLGALTTNAPPDYKEAIREFGKRLGIMYQMVDDVIDGDAPQWLVDNFEEELKEQYRLALIELDRIPTTDNNSEYKEAARDLIGFMLTKLAKEGKVESVVRKVVETIETVEGVEEPEEEK